MRPQPDAPGRASLAQRLAELLRCSIHVLLSQVESFLQGH
jgi:hypothetical protein